MIRKLTLFVCLLISIAAVAQKVVIADHWKVGPFCQLPQFPLTLWY